MNTDGKSDADKGFDDFLMPGFRFHPTDQELVGFYLKRKLQLRPLPVELIKQVDIYKYDPWELPKLASTGEKEWYFYCPRDRKYRNSTRPNRVTGSGFWKATGTDRPIYSSDGAKCIGLKKSLVFYRGRAAKGVKTDWMMHEFRLPSTVDGAVQAPAAHKTILHKNLPLTDSWAICRIFKKANSMANRAISYSWQAPDGYHNTSENHFGPDNSEIHPWQANIFTSSENENFPENVIFSEVSGTSSKSAADLTSMLLNLAPNPCKASSFDTRQQQLNVHSVISSNTVQASMNVENEPRKNQAAADVHNALSIRSIGFPFSLPPTLHDSWDSPPCPSEISSTNHSTNKCYT